MSKKKFLEAFPAAPVAAAKPVTATAGIGQPVEVRTVSALVHLTILNARRAKAVADILRRAKGPLAATFTSMQKPAPRSNETSK